MQHIPLRAAGALLVNATIWGLSWVAFKSLQQQGIHPLWATALIFSFCTIWMLLLKRKSLREMCRHPELIYVAIASGMTNTAFNGAVAFGDVVRVVLLFYLMPIWTVILARLVLHEPITRPALLRIALGLSGAMIVLYQPSIGVPLPHDMADWVALFGGFSFAVNNVMLRRLHDVADGARAIAMLSGGAVLSTGLGVAFAAVGLIAWPGVIGTPSVPTLALWSVLFMASNLCLQYGVARLPANIAAVIMLAEIIIAAVSAWLFGAAELRVQDIVGGALIIATPWLIRDRRPAMPAH
ncbi:DMT family transporter [Herbaspirillum sp. RV1423]|uniref:DMT family transporter n=1 Tax=Herbaspirillum sp. RV1423 TaxID=1443993 RepID=UPI0005511881|nr:DMT family transporter [Herbaspirillum sp. RV1423]